MADTIALSSDPRRRNLTALALVAAVMTLFAVLALTRQARQVAPHYAPRTFLQGLASEVRDVAHVRLDSKSGTVDVVFKPDRGWVVASYENYPASFEKVRETL